MTADSSGTEASLPPAAVARGEFIVALPNGDRRPVTLVVGRPSLLDATNGEEEWGCPISISGPAGFTSVVLSRDPLQALCLALSRAFRILHRQADGGILLLRDQAHPVSLEDYLDVPQTNCRPGDGHRGQACQS